MEKTKKIISLLATLVFLLGVFSPALAQTEEATGEATPTVDPEIKEKVEERIQKVLNAESDEKLAFVGEIIDINSSIELDTKEGEKRFKADEDATIVGLKKEDLEVEDLEIGSWVIAMGYLDDGQVLAARRVVVIEKPETPDRLVAFGEVTDKSSDGEEILTVKHPLKEKIYEIEVTGKTTIERKVDGEIEEIEFKEIKVGDRILAVGAPDEEEENGFLTATLIRVAPASDQAEEKSETSDEATPTAEEE